MLRFKNSHLNNIMGISCLDINRWGRKVVATSTTSDFALKIEIFFFGLIIKNNGFKKFSYRFGVMKIKIDSARALERRCDHFTPPPTKLGLNIN